MPELPAFRLLITGARRTSERENEFVEETLTRFYRQVIGVEWELIVVHGKYGGVDKAADDWASREWGNVAPERHPADFESLGRAAGPRRNAHMVSLGAHAVMAFPGPGSRGTWDCLQKAVKAGIKPYLYPLHIYVTGL